MALAVEDGESDFHELELFKVFHLLHHLILDVIVLCVVLSKWHLLSPSQSAPGCRPKSVHLLRLPGKSRLALAHYVVFLNHSEALLVVLSRPWPLLLHLLRPSITFATAALSLNLSSLGKLEWCWLLASDSIDALRSML